MQESVLITGGARRLGRAMALHLANRGYQVALHYNTSIKEAQATQASIGETCTLFQANLENPTEAQNMFDQVVNKYPKLSTLINNASVFQTSALLENTAEEIRRDFSVHFQSPLTLIQSFAKRRKKGKIINVVDAAVAKDASAYFSYLLAKKSLQDLTQMAARELGPDILVNALAPGFILPPEGKEISEERLKNIPLHRQGTPQDMTQALDFLLKHDFITGQTLYVDGGEHLN